MSSGDAASWISATAAAVGLIFTAWQLYKNNKTRQLQIAENIFSDIKDLLFRLSEIPEGQEAKVTKWTELLLNQLEWFSFLVNNKKLQDSNMISFFEPFIRDCVEDSDLGVYNIVDKNNEYSELKKFYDRIKKKPD